MAVPFCTISSTMRSYSAWEPSHHSTAAGWQSAAISFTHAITRAWRVGGDEH